MNIVSISSYTCIEFIILLYIFSVISWYKQYKIYLIPFSKFSDVLTAFTCENTIDNLWSICLGANILSPLHFCCLWKSRIFLTISITLSGFSNWEFFFSQNISPKISPKIFITYIFSSFPVLSGKFPGNFNEDIFYLNFIVCAIVTLGVSNTVGLVVSSRVDSHVG